MKSVLVLLSEYNGAHFISEQLESVLRQRDVDVHILIRSDGSTSENFAVIEEFKNKYENLNLIQGNNIGFALSFSALIEYAYKYNGNYDYFAFCDQDDVWLEDKLISAVELLDQQQASSSSLPVCYASYTTLVDKNLNVIRDGEAPSYFKFSKGRCLVRTHATGCTMVFNYKALEIYANHMPSHLYAHDMMMWQICIFLGKVIWDPKSHILYRQHGHNQIGSKNFVDRMKGRLNFTKNRGVLQNHCLEFLRLYKDCLKLDDIAIVSKLAFYKKSFFSKLNLLFDREITYDNFESNIFYRLKVLWGGV